jgi:hypothetical protein
MMARSAKGVIQGDDITDTERKSRSGSDTIQIDDHAYTERGLQLFDFHFLPLILTPSRILGRFVDNIRRSRFIPGEV